MKDKQICTLALMSLIFMLFSFHFEAVITWAVLKVIEDLSVEFLHSLDMSFGLQCISSEMCSLYQVLPIFNSREKNSLWEEKWSNKKVKKGEGDRTRKAWNRQVQEYQKGKVF